MKILFVDDEDIMVQVMLDVFGDQIDICSTVNEAFQKLEKEKYNLVLTDYSLAGGGGVKIANYCIAKSIPCVINSGYSRDQMEGLSNKLQTIDKMDCLRFLINFIQGSAEIDEK